jgi:hypothetical protein
MRRPICCRVFTLRRSDIAEQGRAVAVRSPPTLLRIAADPKHGREHRLVDSSALTHHPHCTRRRLRRQALGRVQTGGVAAPCGPTEAANTWRWPTPRLHGLARAAAQVRVGGLRQEEAVLAYLSRHRVAISAGCSRWTRAVSFRWKDLQGHDAGPGGVHAPIPVACTAVRLPSHPATAGWHGNLNLALARDCCRRSFGPTSRPAKSLHLRALWSMVVTGLLARLFDSCGSARSPRCQSSAPLGHPGAVIRYE